MFSTTSWIIFGIIAIIAVVVLWKWWNKPETTKAIEVENINKGLIEGGEATAEPPPPEQQNTFGQPAPPMVFAVNDNGNFDLTDMSGKILNIGFGPNPKTYINLLDQSEKDIRKDETTGNMVSNVGTTKLYEIGGRPYIVNFTRL
jgi:hypothetical protein